MTLEELYMCIRDAFESTPSEMMVHFGCDCGCGGDYYSGDEWDEAHNYIEREREKIISFCKEKNIDYKDTWWLSNES